MCSSDLRVLIDAFDIPDAMVIALVRATRAAGGHPYVQIHRARVTRELALGAEEAQYAPYAEIELARMRKMDAYIALRGSDNIFEASDVPSARVQLVSRLMKPVLDHRVGKTKWVVLRWPTSSMAQQATMSTEAFEDFYFRVCTLDYGRMVPGMKALAELMKATDRVHIKGPGTDLRFSIKGIGARQCGGLRNIPDGEVFSCPVKDSVEGHIQYNAPTVYLGSSFDNIRLQFRQGRIVDASSSNTRRLNAILDSDAGARYIGEFAIVGGLSGVHQYVRIGKHAMVGGVTGVDKDVIPYALAMGNRARLTGLDRQSATSALSHCRSPPGAGARSRAAAADGRSRLARRL